MKEYLLSDITPIMESLYCGIGEYMDGGDGQEPTFARLVCDDKRMDFIVLFDDEPVPNRFLRAFGPESKVEVTGSHYTDCVDMANMLIASLA